MSRGRAAAPALALFLTMAAGHAAAQEFFRCTAPDGKVTYQQTPCPGSSQERKVDATPANPDYDPAQRERVLKQGEEAGKRLEERAAREAEEARRREDQRLRDEQREREARAREEARDIPVVSGWPAWWGQPRPGPYPPRPPTRPQPRPLPSTPTR